MREYGAGAEENALNKKSECLDLERGGEQTGGEVQEDYTYL